MGGLTAIEEVTVPSDLWNRVKHPECVERIVAELSDGREVDAGFSRPESLVVYRIEYRQGPCRNGCSSLLPEIQEKGCYNGRVDRIEVSTIDQEIDLLRNLRT